MGAIRKMPSGRERERDLTRRHQQKLDGGLFAGSLGFTWAQVACPLLLLLLLLLFPALVKLIRSLFISAVSRLSRERDPLLNSNRVVVQHDVLGNDDDWTNGWSVGLAVNIDSNYTSSVSCTLQLKLFFNLEATVEMRRCISLPLSFYGKFNSLDILVYSE